MSLCRSLIWGFRRAPTNKFVHFDCLKSISTQSASLWKQSTASFDDVKNAKKSLLIDVREPSELQETGVIPGSVNIPLGDIESVLKNMSPDEFSRKYGKPKPKLSESLIFFCKMGKRSASAQDIAQKLGFNNTKNYEGGWMDWEERNRK